MANKNSFILVALCLVLVALTVAAQTQSIKFVNDAITRGSDSIVEITVSGYDLSQDLTLTPALVSGETDTTNKVVYLWEPTQPTQISSLAGTSNHLPTYCWDTTTGQNIAEIETNEPAMTVQQITGTSITIKFLSDRWHLVSEATGEAGMKTKEFTFRCPIHVYEDSDFTPVNVFNIQFAGEDFDGDSIEKDVTLTFPQKGFVSPVVDFKSASASAAKRVGESTEVKVEFTTDAAGLYTVFLQNGPAPYQLNLNNGDFADLHCSAGKTKDFARIVYAGSTITVYVPQPSPTDAIKCTFLYDSAGRSLVGSDRSIVQLAFGPLGGQFPLSVYQSLDFKAPTPVMAVQLVNKDLTIASDLSESTLRIKTNSSIVFKFSPTVDVRSLFTQSNGEDDGYRRFDDCDDFIATAKFDDKKHTITLTDIFIGSLPSFVVASEMQPLQSGNDAVLKNLECTFKLQSIPEVFDFSSGRIVDMFTVSTTIDGVTLDAFMSRSGKDAPIYLPTVGSLSHELTQTTVDGTKNKYESTFSFQDRFDQIFTTMQNPIAVFSFTGGRTSLLELSMYSFPYAADKAAEELQCQSTDPTSSAFKPLVLKFDQDTLTWSVRLKNLVDVESYSLLFKCKYAIPKVLRFGYDVSFHGAFKLEIVDLIDGKRFNPNNIASESAPVAPNQATSQTDAYPTTSVFLAQATMSLITAAPLSDQVRAAQRKLVVETVNKLIKDADFTKENPDWTFADFASLDTPDFASSANYYLPNHITRDFIQKDILANAVNYKTNAVQERRNLNTLGFHNVHFSVTPLLNDVSASTEVTAYFTATTTDKDNGVPTWNGSSDDKTISNSEFIETDFLSKKLGTDSILDSYDETALGNSGNVSPVKGCGLKNVGFTMPKAPGYDMDSDKTTWADEEAKWEAWTNITSDSDNVVFMPCHDGQACETNSDCLSTSCIKSVCVPLKTVAPPFVPFSPDFSTKSFDKDNYSSATLATTFLAVIGALAVALW